MSNALATVSLLDAVKGAIQAAFGGTFPVSYGNPRVPLNIGSGYAVIHWLPVEISFDGHMGTVRRPQQQNSFLVILRFPFPSDPTVLIDLQKIIKANLLIAQLQTGPNFAGGALPLVTNVDPIERDPVDEQVYEVRLTFSVLTAADHH